MGTPWRLNTIYQTNLHTAYQCGKYRRLTRPSEKNTRPYWQYIAVLDSRTRPSHAALHGKILRADDRFWETHYPPNGFNCRCTVRALSEKELDSAGLETVTDPDGTIRHNFVKGTVEKSSDLLKRTDIWPDQGWDYHPCEGWKPDAVRHENLDGIFPKDLWNRFKNFFVPSSVLKIRDIDPDLLTDLSALKQTEAYAEAIRKGILEEMKAGGLEGSAILKHELSETAELTKAGFDVYNPDDIDKIRKLFRQAEKTGEPGKHIPFHLKALKDEIEYVQKKLADKNISASLDEVASALYRVPSGDEYSKDRIAKLMTEFEAIGIKWEPKAKETIIRAIQMQTDI